MANYSHGEMRRPALGEHHAIGDCYDARTDSFSGLSILDKDLPESTIKVRDDYSSNVQRLVSNSTSEKFDKLGIKGEMKLNVLFKTVSLGGHARYLSEDRANAKSGSSSLFYHITTKVMSSIWYSSCL